MCTQIQHCNHKDPEYCRVAGNSLWSLITVFWHIRASLQRCISKGRHLLWCHIQLLWFFFKKIQLVQLFIWMETISNRKREMVFQKCFLQPCNIDLNLEESLVGPTSPRTYVSFVSTLISNIHNYLSNYSSSLDNSCTAIPKLWAEKWHFFIL